MKHVKWTEKKLSATELQLAFEAGLKARQKRRSICSNKSLSAALKANMHRACYSYTPNNYAELEYRGTLSGR